MNRNVKIGAAAAAIILVAGCVIYGISQGPVGASPEFAQWKPTAAAIRNVIGGKDAPAAGMTDTDRRIHFCELFKSRYRSHDPKIAVGVRFISPNVLKLMCPARMEPCYIDEIALSLWHEARDDFGSSMDIQIYNTFIGTNNIRIGQLKPMADHPDIARITYDYTGLLQLNRSPGRRRQTIPPRPILDPIVPPQLPATSHRATL